MIVIYTGMRDDFGLLMFFRFVKWFYPIERLSVSLSLIKYGRFDSTLPSLV